MTFSDVAYSVETLEMYSYAAVAIMTVVGYDYVLTFSREINIIWLKPWTRVSTLFLIVRYVGLCWSFDLALAGGIFVPGPIKVHYFKGIAMLVVGDWGYMLFLAAADLVMILRVYALWNQSKIILGILLCCYVPQVISSLVWEILYDIPNKSLSVSIIHTFHYSTCHYTPHHTPPFGMLRAIPRFIVGVALVVLAAIPTLKQTIRMYRCTKRLQSNMPMKLLMKEGAVYFIVNVLFNLAIGIDIPDFKLKLFLNAISYVLSCVLMPRFIMSIRELYEKEPRDRWQGIDTGFGTWTEPVIGPTETW